MLNPTNNEMSFHAAVTSVIAAWMAAYHIFFTKRRKLLVNRLKSRKISRRLKTHDDTEMLLLLHLTLTQTLYGRRRFWADARSQHWVYHVSEGVLLQQDAFEKTFRLSRRSFNKLLSYLGSSPF